jgi:hypothetical protein
MTDLHAIVLPHAGTRPPAPPVAPGDPGWEERALRAFDAGEPMAAALCTAPRGAVFALAWLLVVLLATLALGVAWRLEDRAPATQVAPPCGEVPRHGLARRTGASS